MCSSREGANKGDFTGRIAIFLGTQTGFPGRNQRKGPYKVGGKEIITLIEMPEGDRGPKVRTKEGGGRGSLPQ